MNKSFQWIRQFASIYQWINLLHVWLTLLALLLLLSLQQQHQKTVGIPDPPQTFQIHRPKIISEMFHVIFSM